MKTVLIYVNTSAGDVDHIVVFANEEAAEKWFADNDAEGVAFTETKDTPWESNSSTSLAKSASDLVKRSTL